MARRQETAEENAFGSGDAGGAAGRAIHEVEEPAPVGRPSMTELAGEVASVADTADQPEPLDRAPMVGDIATAPRESLLPETQEDVSQQQDSGGPSDAGRSGPVDLVEDLGIDRIEPTEEEVFLDPEDVFAPDINAGNLSEHEQAMFDDLSSDALEDPMSVDQSVPADYDLSGNEAGDGTSTPGPTNANPTPDHTWDESGLNGFRQLREGETDPDRITMLDERAHAAASNNEDDYDGDPHFGDFVASIFGVQTDAQKYEEAATQEAAAAQEAAEAAAQAKAEAEAAKAAEEAAQDWNDEGWEPLTEDYDPDSAPAPKNPSLDPDVGERYHAIGVEAERNSEVQFADTPESGSDGSGDYDGVDYGQHHVEPDFDLDDAEAVLSLDPLDQPDVDPIEHGGAADFDLELE